MRFPRCDSDAVRSRTDWTHKPKAGMPARGRQALIDACATGGFRQMTGYIDGDNKASLGLHEKFGFARVGLLPGVAFRHGCQRHGAALGPGSPAPALSSSGLGR